MNCQQFEADIVDLARGAGRSVEAGARLQEHLAGCAGCSARFAREQRLTAALREVADSAQQPVRSDAIEAQLLQAFAAQHATRSRQPSSSHPPVATRPAWGWLAAAAVLVLTAVLWRGTGGWRSLIPAWPTPGESVTAPSAARATPAPAAEPAPRSAEMRIPAAPRPAELTIPAPPLGASPRAAADPARATRGLARPTGPSEDEGVLRFVSLPTAIGLPEFESGRIVRVELASAALPAFGFDVVPGSESGVVEADVLVGQDDQPRAIRFVDLKTDSRRGR